MSELTPATIGVRLLGVTVCGPAPIGRVHLPMHEPLLALYGRNGAGKTRLLRAAIAALCGVRLDDSWGLVHVQLPDPDADLEGGTGDPWLDALAGGLREHLNRVRGDVVAHFARRRDEEFDEGPGDEYAEVIEDFRSFTQAVVDEAHSPTTVRELVGAHLAASAMLLGELEHVGDFMRFHTAAIAEITRGGHVVLRATGTREAPRWTVYAAASEEGAAVAELLDQDRAVLVAADWDPEDTGAIGRPVIPDVAERLASNSGFPWRELSDISDAFISGRGYVGPGLTPAADTDVTGVPWPLWATVPVLEVASISVPLVALVTDETTTSDVDQLTRDQIRRASSGAVLERYASGSAHFHAGVDPLLDRLTADASRYLRLVFPDAPELIFAPGDPNAWLAGDLPRWVARFADNSTLPLAALSTAQRRWAGLSCALAVSTAAAGALPVVFCCDEPESGLHRRAEAGLPDALVQMSADSGLRVVVATHSPAMLDPSRVVLSHVTRLASGAATATGMDFALRSELDREDMREELGLTPADLLQMVRCIVIVEGKHDEVVLGALLAPDLDSGTVIYPVGGAKAMMSLATAGLIWDFTDAAIVIVVDNVARATIAPVWEKVQASLARGGTESAIRALVPLGKLPGAEARWLQNLLTKAIKAHRAPRIRLETLSAPDVICYLPAEEFVPGATWDELLTEWRESFNGAEPTNLKAFLTNRHKVAFTTSQIARIAVGAKADAELQAFGARIRALSVGGSWPAAQVPDVPRPGPPRKATPR
ncbi:MAG: ATP-dependent nuclease [Sporichthyaceae bacterium]